MLYFIEKFNGVFVTQMNKLLFYADFLAYRSRGLGLTGLVFKAVPYGPVPERWDRVYSLVDDIEQMPIESKNGNSGTKLVSALEFDEASLSEEELSCLAKVYETFKNETPSSMARQHSQSWTNRLRLCLLAEGTVKTRTRKPVSLSWNRFSSDSHLAQTQIIKQIHLI